MECYVNAMSSADTDAPDLKTLIPDAALRRRMSRVVKSGVGAAMDALARFGGGERIDAVVTATGLGCLADSEKFLRNLVENDEQLLNPTPFIQSTFNTVGAQVALLCKNHSYNMTYSHRGRSFECALLDAVMSIREGTARNVLLGAFDEMTPSLHRIWERMGFLRGIHGGECACFFVLSEERSENALARVAMPEFLSRTLTREEVNARCGGAGVRILWNEYAGCGLCPTASALTFRAGIEAVAAGMQRAVIYNSFRGEAPTIMEVECI